MNKGIQTLGFFMLMIGAAGLDSEGKWYMLAMVLGIVGVLVIFFSSRREG